MSIDINFVKEYLVKDSLDNVDGYDLAGYFRMCFRSKWLGKWFAESSDFAENGVTEVEREQLKAFCVWVEESFPNGCDDALIDYLNNNENIDKASGGYFVGMPIDDASYAVIKYTIDYGNDDYIIRIYLYRKKEN